MKPAGARFNTQPPALVSPSNRPFRRTSNALLSNAFSVCQINIKTGMVGFCYSFAIAVSLSDASEIRDRQQRRAVDY